MGTLGDHLFYPVDARLEADAVGDRVG